mgnify:CR=1 FL=1
MIVELNKLHNLLNDVKDSLTSVIDVQIKTHESLKQYYLKLLEYAQDFENEQRLKKLELEIFNAEDIINDMKKQIDTIIELVSKK